MKIIDFVPILLGIVCIVLGQVFKGAETVLTGIGGALCGWGSLNRPSAMAGQVGNTLKLGILVPFSFLCLGGCHNVPADQFFGAVVDCAKVDPASSAALAGVETCLIGAVAENPAACLSGLVAEGTFTVQEVACVVAWEAQQANKKVAATADPAAVAKRDVAANWLAAEKIGIKNTYY